MTLWMGMWRVLWTGGVESPWKFPSKTFHYLQPSHCSRIFVLPKLTTYCIFGKLKNQKDWFCSSNTQNETFWWAIILNPQILLHTRQQGCLKVLQGTSLLSKNSGCCICVCRKIEVLFLLSVEVCWTTPSPKPNPNLTLLLDLCELLYSQKVCSAVVRFWVTQDLTCGKQSGSVHEGLQTWGEWNRVCSPRLDRQWQSQSAERFFLVLLMVC